jgi:putative membrane protein
MHEHHDAALPGLLLLGGLCGYTALVCLPLRRRPWPPWRTVSWFTGLGAAGFAVLGPPGGGFVGHSTGHLLLGMLAPLLVCAAAPVTLLLRGLPVAAARRVSRLLRSAPVAVLTHPATVVVLDAGGLWLLYATPLYRIADEHPAVHLAVQAHVFVAGCVLTVALVGPDPMPHRAPPVARAMALVVFLAAHGMLAKFLYGHPPAGVPAGDAERGAMIMYYGGDLVDVALLVLLCREWYRRRSRVALRLDRTADVWRASARRVRDVLSDVTVVIATRNGAVALRRMLERLAALPDRPAAVVVVDNASTDGAPDMVADRFPEVSVLRLPRNEGAVARNHGVSPAETPYVAFVDDDSW